MYKIEKETIQIENLMSLIEKFKNHSSSLIENLKGKFERQAIITQNVSDSSFEFCLWGQKFISKAELSFNKDSRTIQNGELNTYFVNTEESVQIISYTFDTLGNIGNGDTNFDFADSYFVEFIKSLIEFSINKNIKIQLS